MRRARAQGLIELALLLPLLLGLLLGALTVARLLWYDQVVWSLAGEAARACALGSNPGDAAARAQERAEQMAADAGLDPRRLQVEIDTTHFGRGGWVSVSASYPLAAPLPLGQLADQGPWEVRAHAQEPVDRYRSGISSP